MRVGKIIETQQPIHKRLNKQQRKKHKRGKKESLSFKDVENMMRHDSYKRGKGGALRQK